MAKNMSLHLNKLVFSLLAMMLFVPCVQADQKNMLSEIITSPHRSEANITRDQYRHPQQTLGFFGVQSDMTVIEIWPGKGWYTEILAPYMKQGGGQFIAAGFPLKSGPEWRQNMQAEYQGWLAASPAMYDQVKIVQFGPPYFWTLGKEDSADAVLTFRNVHNWLKGGYEDDMFKAFYKVLKPGGVLGVIDHRAPYNTELKVMKESGYLSEDMVIMFAKKAGFVLEALTDINANELDDKQHPKGVWTLPPTLRLGELDRDKYLAIGESDRMTLRFRKPK